MEEEISFTGHSEAEWVDRFGRMDPRYAPTECARLAGFLTERGYIVTPGQLGPGFAEPSSAKTQMLIGSTRPVTIEVDFGKGANPLNLSTATHNDLGFAGPGMLTINGISLQLSGAGPATPPSLVTTSARLDVRLPYHLIFDVEPLGELLRFAYKAAEFEAGAATVRTVNSAAADRVAALLPKERSKNFHSQITADSQFQQKVTAQAPNTYATYGLVGPLVERLFGSINYLAIYLLAGIVASLTSVAWHPDVNSGGASGAIFGIFGALLAARVRSGAAFPDDIWRPIGKWAGVFVLWNLYAAIRLKGIDYAAHMGGLVSGFLIGLAAARPVTGSPTYTREDMRRLALSLLIGTGLSFGGIWYAKGAAAALTGEGLYWRTYHWFRAGEHAANRRFNQVLGLTKAGRQTHIDLANAVDRDVLPFWHEAARRLSAVDLPNPSQISQNLHLLQDVTDRQIEAFQHLSQGLRDNNSEEVALADQERQKVDEMVRREFH